MKRCIIFWICLGFLIIGKTEAGDIDILKFGAKGDGYSNNTVIIQRAIDQCSRDGGGTISFPAGQYLSGTIFLRNRVSLFLSPQATLKGIEDSSFYPGRHFSECGFIRIDSVRNVSISGSGTIDGSGGEAVFQKGNNGSPRPYLVHVRDSRDVTITGVTLQNSAFWTLRLLGNQRVRIDGLRIFGHANWNNDGIDIDSKDVIISNCYIDVDDDAICLKSDRRNQIVENIVVSNCVLASNCNHIKFGTASHGGFRNVTISNCVLKPASVSYLRKWNERIEGVTDTISATSGIALEVMNGGFMDQVLINNISMRGVQTPIFIRLGGDRSPRGMTGSLKNITISNVQAYSCSKIPSSITAAPGLTIENITLKDINIINSVSENNRAILTKVIPEGLNEYPENRMMGQSLPGYGIYVRRAKNVFLDHVVVAANEKDVRPAFWFEHAEAVVLRSSKGINEGNTPLMFGNKAQITNIP